MSQINIIGCMDNTKDHTFESANRVYGVDGICPTIPTCAGGGIQPKIIEVQRCKKGGNMMGNKGKQQIVYDDFNSAIRADQSTMATLTTNCGSSCLRNGVKLIEVEQIDVAPEFERFVYEIDGELYLIRIRKLTPLECWRLMGFSDADFEKAATVNSNTQLYKQAGNSIVENVLMHLFRMFLPTNKVDALKQQALALLG